MCDEQLLVDCVGSERPVNVVVWWTGSVLTDIHPSSWSQPSRVLRQQETAVRQVWHATGSHLHRDETTDIPRVAESPQSSCSRRCLRYVESYHRTHTQYQWQINFNW